METTLQITENNKLIAEFMGYKNNPEISDTLMINSRLKSSYHLEDCKYNTSWDWLMPVIFRLIESKDIYPQLKHQLYNSIEPDLSKAYNFCVKLIKEINKQI